MIIAWVMVSVLKFFFINNAKQGIELFVTWPNELSFPEFIPPVEIPSECFKDIPDFFPMLGGNKVWWEEQLENQKMPPLEDPGIRFLFI